MYKIEVTCHYEELWRYNMVVTCGGYDTSAEQLYVVGCERITNEEFLFDPKAKEPTPPPNYNPSEPLILECNEADSIHAIIYVIAHTLPHDRYVENSPPFAIEVKIYRNDERIYIEQHLVNQWGGATVNINI